MRKNAQRKSSEVRNEEILSAAIAISKKIGYPLLSVGKVAEKSNVSKPLVLYHYKSIEALKNKVVSAAIDREILPIIAQGIVHNHKSARRLEEDLRKKVIDFVFSPKRK